MQKGPPFRGDRLPIGTPAQRVHIGFRDSWKPRLGCWSWRRLQRSAARFLSEAKPLRERLTLIRLFEELRGRGYEGGYDAVRRYARRWAKERGQATAAAFVPLSFAPGDAY